MNNKRPYRSDAPKPEYLHEVKVPSGTKTYTLAKGMLVSVYARPNLPGGKWVFLFAEPLGDELGLHVEGPVTRRCRAHRDCDGHPRHKVIRLSDIKQVHIKQR